MVQVTMRFDRLPSRPVNLAAACGGAGCRGAVVLPAPTAAQLGQWRTLGVPLKCLARAGADVTRIETVVELSTEGTLDLSLSRVEVGTVADQTIGC